MSDEEQLNKMLELARQVHQQSIVAARNLGQDPDVKMVQFLDQFVDTDLLDSQLKEISGLIHWISTLIAHAKSEGNHENAGILTNGYVAIDGLWFVGRLLLEVAQATGRFVPPEAASTASNGKPN